MYELLHEYERVYRVTINIVKHGKLPVLVGNDENATHR
jgi:hypothetical protein